MAGLHEATSTSCVRRAMRLVADSLTLLGTLATSCVARETLLPVVKLGNQVATHNELPRVTRPLDSDW